jgi:hypothetical protein
MGKKCTICGEEAELKIKNSSDYYCNDCALENFGDITVLVKIDEEAKRLKALVDQQIDEN